MTNQTVFLVQRAVQAQIERWPEASAAMRGALGALARDGYSKNEAREIIKAEREAERERFAAERR